MAQVQTDGESVAVPAEATQAVTTQAVTTQKIKLSEFKEMAHCVLFSSRPTLKEACDYAREMLGDDLAASVAIGVLLNTLTEVLEND